MATKDHVITLTVQSADLYTVKQAAVQLGRPPLTIYRWIERERIHAVRFDGILYVPRSEVERIKSAEADQAAVSAPADQAK